MVIASVKVALKIQTGQTNSKNEFFDVLDNAIHLHNGKSFYFDTIYPKNVTQEQVYKLSIAPLLCRFIEGESVTIIADRPSVIERTYTLSVGPEPSWKNGEILHQSIYSLFNQLKDAKKFATTEVYASLLSVNQSCLQDLFHHNLKPEVDDEGNWKNEQYQKVCTAEHLIELLRQSTEVEQTGCFPQPHFLFSILLKEKKLSHSTRITPRLCFIYMGDPKNSKKSSLELGPCAERFVSEIPTPIYSGASLVDNVASYLASTNRSSCLSFQNKSLLALLESGLKTCSHTFVMVCVNSTELNLEKALETLERASKLSSHQSSWAELEYLRSRVSQLKMQVSLLSGVQANRKMESEIEVLNEEIRAIRVYVKNLKHELIQTKSEKDALLILNDTKDIEVHPIIQNYVQQIQDLKFQIAQTKMKLNSTLQRKQSSSWNKRASSSSSLLSKAFDSSISLDSRKYISKARCIARRVPKRGLGPKPRVSHSPVYTPERSQIDLLDNHEGLFQYLQKENEEPTGKAEFDDSLELSFEKFSFPSFTDEINQDSDGYTSPCSSPSQSRLPDSIYTKEEKSEVLAVPTWSEDFRNNPTKRVSISVDSMWDDTDSSITTSNIGSAIEVPTTSTSFKNDRKQNRKLLKMIHQSQADFLVKQELVGQLEKSEDLYIKMQSNYENKLNELKQHLVTARKQKGNDFKKSLVPHSLPVFERPQSALQLRENKQVQELRSEYETKLKQLMGENQDLRKKNTDLTRISRTAQVEADAVISQLHKSIEVLQTQKKQLRKSLKTEADNSRESSTMYEREISHLKRREAVALEAKDRLEKDNSAQAQLVKRRSEETVTANTQVRQLTNSLRKAASAGTFLNEANLDRLLNGVAAVIKPARRRSTIGLPNPPIINTRKKANGSSLT